MYMQVFSTLVALWNTWLINISSQMKTLPMIGSKVYLTGEEFCS